MNRPETCACVELRTHAAACAPCFVPLTPPAAHTAYIYGTVAPCPRADGEAGAAACSVCDTGDGLALQLPAGECMQPPCSKEPVLHPDSVTAPQGGRRQRQIIQQGLTTAPGWALGWQGSVVALSPTTRCFTSRPAALLRTPSSTLSTLGPSHPQYPQDACLSSSTLALLSLTPVGQPTTPASKHAICLPP